MYAIVSLVLGVIIGLVGTILAFIFIVPEKKREKLPSFFKFVHDLFNFKFLIIEKIIQALYIFSTMFIIGFGFFRLFYVPYGTYMGWVGLLLLLFGPACVRLVYEGCMMFIILVKNSTQINDKLSKKDN